jgi:hypothetical protein
MRYLSSMFFVNCLFFSFGQTIGVPQNSYNSNSTYEKEAKWEVDSTQQLLPSAPIRDLQKAGKAKSKKMEMVQSTGAVDVLKESQSLQQNSMSSRFYSIKNTANTQRFSRSPSIEQQQEMDHILLELQRIAPNSYDYHMAKYLAGNHDVSNEFHLKRAETLRPNSTDVLVQNVAFFASLLDTTGIKVNLKKLVDSKWLSNEILQYAENMLQATPVNGVLVSHGIQDSYALLFAQLFRAVRLDVHCVSMDILQGERYRENLQKKGFVLPEYKGVNVAYLQAFCQLNRNRNVCLSMTIPKDYLQQMSNQLTVFGLVFVFDFSQNMQVVFEENERFFNRELTTKSLFETPTVSGNCLEANYLPMLMYLSKMYEFSSDVTKLNRVELAILNVVKRCKLDVDKLQIRK